MGGPTLVVFLLAQLELTLEKVEVLADEARLYLQALHGYPIAQMREQTSGGGQEERKRQERGRGLTCLGLLEMGKLVREDEEFRELALDNVRDLVQESELAL